MKINATSRLLAAGQQVRFSELKEGEKFLNDGDTWQKTDAGRSRAQPLGRSGPSYPIKPDTMVERV